MTDLEARVFTAAFTDELEKIARDYYDSGDRYVRTPQDSRRTREVIRNTPAGETAVRGALGGAFAGTAFGALSGIDDVERALAAGAEKSKGLYGRKIGKGALIGAGIGAGAGAGLSLLNRAIARSKMSRNWDDRYDEAERSIRERQGRR